MRISRAALVFIAFPVALAAQQPAVAPSNPITAVMKQRTIAFQRRLAQAFDSIPESILGYKPTPAQLSIGFIAQDLANGNYFYCSRFGAMKGGRAAEDPATAGAIKAQGP